MENTPIYKIWAGIKSRCFKTYSKDYKNYGGRGITICEEWRESFEAFYAYIGPRPSPQHSVDRINNNGNYEPGNVRWATRDVQVSNRRCTRLITYDGATRTIRDWSTITGLSRSLILSRLAYGKSPKEILTRPSHFFKGTPVVDNDSCREMSRLYDAGWEVVEIAAQFKVSRGKVHCAIKGIGTRGETFPPAKRPLRPLRPKGEDCRHAKLSESDALEIRALYDAAELPLREIGRMFGITSVMAALIGKRKSWKHVPEPTSPPAPEPEPDSAEPQRSFPWAAGRK